jgi:molybdenum cofactor cytidylyltransferase
MPHIMPSTTWRVVQALRSGAVLAAPFYGGRRGHPVGFHAAFAQDLSHLDGDTGARSILQQNAGKLVRLDVNDPSVTRDIDTPGQLAAANRL